MPLVVAAPRLRFPPDGFPISRRCQLSRHRRDVRYCEADVIEGGTACRAGRLLRVQEEEGVGKLNYIDAPNFIAWPPSVPAQNFVWASTLVTLR